MIKEEHIFGTKNHPWIIIFECIPEENKMIVYYLVHFSSAKENTVTEIGWYVYGGGAVSERRIDDA